MPKNRVLYQKTLTYRLGHAQKYTYVFTRAAMPLSLNFFPSTCHASACLLYTSLVWVLLLRVLHLDCNLSVS